VGCNPIAHASWAVAGWLIIGGCAAKGVVVVVDGCSRVFRCIISAVVRVVVVCCGACGSWGGGTAAAPVLCYCCGMVVGGGLWYCGLFWCGVVKRGCWL
jgi:hypothetical protein